MGRVVGVIDSTGVVADADAEYSTKERRSSLVLVRATPLVRYLSSNLSESALPSSIASSSLNGSGSQYQTAPESLFPPAENQLPLSLP